MTYLLLIIGLVLLIFGGDALVNGAVSIAKKMGLSSLLIGLVLVGFGTSMPELLASLISTFRGANGIAVGNVVGSNIANILLVLGLSALIFPVKIELKSFKRDSVFLLLSTLLLVAGVFFGEINRIFGGVLVLSIAGYVYYSYVTDKQQQKENESVDEEKTSFMLAFIKVFGGIALMMLGAKFLIDNAIVIAKEWGVSESVIGLTIVAVGTSLPELTTSAIASIKKENGIAFGNVVGSNIYNILFILGFVAIFMPIEIPNEMRFDTIIMSVITIILCLIAFLRREFSRTIGALFLLSYVGYICYLF